MLGSATAFVVDGATMIPIGAALGMMLFVSRITRRWTQVEMEIAQMRQDISDLKRAIERLTNK
jgi:hypothetical protein